MTRILKNQGLYESRWERDGCGIGAVVNISGQRDHPIIEYGKEILINLHHRGAAGADEVTGDGAGILFQIPHEFLRAECNRLGFSLPPASKYGVGMVFGSQNGDLRKKCDDLLESALSYYGLKLLGWRDVPTSNDCLGLPIILTLSMNVSVLPLPLFISGTALIHSQAGSWHNPCDV